VSKEIEEFDVIVVGAGLAGHCAALEAAHQKGSVLLLEKTDRYGGSSRMCGGAFAFAGTDIQKKNAIVDTPELLEEDLMRAGAYRNDRSLVHVYAERQYEAYQWLQALGLRFEKVSLSGSQSVPRNHSTDPIEALEILHANVLQSGVMYLPNSPVERLLTTTEGAERQVVGVRLVSGQRYVAKCGVVLATGGFSRAADLVERFVPHLRAARAMGGYGNTGDGLRMAWALGADLLDMPHAKGTFGAPLNPPSKDVEDNVPRLISAMYRGAIIVNGTGKRFIDESISYKTIGDSCLTQPDARAFQIFDQTVMEQSSPLPTVADFEGALEAGMIIRATSLEELATKLNIDGDALRTTIQKYNDACRGLVPDEFNRKSLSTGYGKPTPVETAPFYGYPCTTGLTSTYCGLRTDNTARVLDVFGEPIAGLYATGEIMGGFHGEAYMSGSSLAKGCIFGRLAAQHAMGRSCDNDALGK
jgi:fumarate reductase flavoprotein subunit